jgi:hypothetical protein
MAWENLNLRTGELGFVVLQRQGHKVKTLRGGGSFRCCKSKASCSSLFPLNSLEKWLASNYNSRAEKCCLGTRLFKP